METVTFEVPGTPVPQSRPRFTRQGHAYEDKKVREYKYRVARIARLVMGGREPMEGPLSCQMLFYMPIPKSLSKKKRQELDMAWTTKKPDTDNLAKAIMDAVNGIVWKDDSQVSILDVVKRYGEEPRAEVEIGKLGCEDSEQERCQ